MTKHYIFFTRNVLPQPNAAHLIHDVNTANAAANLGYPAVLVYLHSHAFNPLDWIYPFRPRKPSPKLIQFYSVQEKLRVVTLAMPWPVDVIASKWTNASTLTCKYYFPVHIFSRTKIVHTLDWNLVKAAIKHNIPVIYEREHYQHKKYEPEIVCSPLFQIAVTVADPVRDNMIQNGMPPEKIVKLPLGFNQAFLSRQPQSAQAWRKQLLDDRKHLVVYSGGLYQFKGVDLLIEVAKLLPQAQFVFAGGDETKVTHYRQLAAQKQVDNATFLGYIPHQQLPSLLQAADVLAHPHCSGEAATFTSPLKFFEYLASGVPIVATQIPPLTEFKVADLIAGWCKPDNPAEFAHCLQQVLDKYPRKEEGYIEQINFARQFTWESRMAKIMSYVEESMRPELV